MIIVNDRRNLPARIMQVQVRNKRMLTKKFLDYVTQPGFKCGVKRYNHYILTADSILRTPFPLEDPQVSLLIRLMQECLDREFTLLMLIF